MLKIFAGDGNIKISRLKFTSGWTPHAGPAVRPGGGCFPPLTDTDRKGHVADEDRVPNSIKRVPCCCGLIQTHRGSQTARPNQRSRVSFVPNFTPINEIHLPLRSSPHAVRSSLQTALLCSATAATTTYRHRLWRSRNTERFCSELLCSAIRYGG